MTTLNNERVDQLVNIAGMPFFHTNCQNIFPFYLLSTFYDNI